MVKLLLSLVMFLLPLGVETIGDSSYDLFMKQIDKAYSIYELSDKSEYNEKYELTIIQGFNKQAPSYGIYFSSKEAKEYYPVLTIEGTRYTLMENDNLDYYAYSITGNIEITIDIYKDDKVVDEGIHLNKLIITDIKNPIEGKANGIEESLLQIYRTKIPFLVIFLVVLSSIILLSGIGIIILFVTKKGFFARDARKTGIIEMRQILNEQSFEETKKEEDYFAELVPEEPKQQEITDIKNYLQDKGFITNYDLLSEEEKNKIMIELINLKNNGLISMDTYYEETCELWKK